MGSNLLAASSQWASRPADERFWTVRDMRIACETFRAGCGHATVPLASLTAAADGNAIVLTGPTGRPADLTHYAFGQLARTVGAPAEYLRELPVETAVSCLNVGLKKTAAAGRSDRDLLFHQNGRLSIRAMLSEQYERVWNSDVCAVLERLEGAGYRVPAGRTPPGYTGKSRPATAADILPGQINIAVGDSIAPAGLYASDHDMFGFLCSADRTVSDGGVSALMRGFFVRNSEVGDSSLVFTFFLMDAVCGNHIVWNARGVHEIRVRHVGRDPMRKAVRQFEAQLRVYMDGAADDDRRMVAAARNMVLGTSKTEVLDAIVKYAKTHSLPLSRARVDSAYDVACEHEDWYGNPRSLWGVVSGLTHASQSGYTEDRDTTDRAAGALLKMVDF